MGRAAAIYRAVMAASFVGRDDELATLVGLVASSTDRRGVDLAVVTGEPGSGKSRLLSELGSRVGDRGLLRMSGWAPERTIPLAAARSLLEELGSVPHEGPRLSRLLDTAAFDRPLDPVQVCEAAHRCVTALSSSVLVVDDLQWLDEVSLALLHYIVRGACSAGSAMAVVIATRPGAAGQTFLTAVARALTEPERLVHLALGPLDRSAGRLLCEAANPGLDPVAVERIVQRSAGSPFWLMALAHTGDDHPGRSALGPVGLSGVTPDAATTAATLAVLAKPVLPTLLGEVLGWPHVRVAAALDELTVRGLVVQTGPASRLTHDLVGEAILDELPAEVVRSTHAAICEPLEGRAGGDTQQLTDALWHRKAAALPCCDLALRLARSPGRRLLGPQDIRAVAAIADDPREPGATSMALRWQLARLTSEVGDPALALESWSTLLPNEHPAGSWQGRSGGVSGRPRPRRQDPGALAGAQVGCRRRSRPPAAHRARRPPVRGGRNQPRRLGAADVAGRRGGARDGGGARGA